MQGCMKRQWVKNMVSKVVFITSMQAFHSDIINGISVAASDITISEAGEVIVPIVNCRGTGRIRSQVVDISDLLLPNSISVTVLTDWMRSLTIPEILRPIRQRQMIILHRTRNISHEESCTSCNRPIL